MIEAFKEYYILFTIIFTFVFTFLQEKCIDKVISHISGPKSAKFSKWFNSLLYSYSRSEIENDCQWLRGILCLLVLIGSLCTNINLSAFNYFIPAIIFIYLVVIAPDLLRKSIWQLFYPRTSEIIIIAILTTLNILYHKPHFFYFSENLQEEEISQYMFPCVIIMLIVKVIPIVVSVIVLLLVKYLKIFTMTLLKHDNPSKYIAKYVLVASSSCLLSLGGIKVITWGKIVITESINNFVHSYLML